MWRIWALFTCFIVFFALITVRLFYWQIIKGDELRAQASAQYNLSLTIPAIRGTIAATDGSPIAMNENASLVYAEPKNIENTAAFATLVSPILGIDVASISATLAIPDRVWLPLAHKVTTEVTSKLKDLRLKGLGFEPEPKRFYPEASMAAQLIGFVGSDQNGLDQGYFGLEGFYDRLLRGRDGSIELQKDVQGSAILVGDTKRIEAEDGRSLTLYIDRTVQNIAENALKNGMEKYGARAGTVTIMDPTTGGILAMAAYPSYDPGNYQSFDKASFINPVVASSYEPGSTFKVLVMSGAIEKGKVKATTKMDENGPVQIG